MQRTKKQHYIPRMILKNHTYLRVPEKYPLVYQYDIFTGKERSVRISDICRKDYLYEYKDDDGNIINRNLIERTLSICERQWDRIITSLKQRPVLSERDKAYLYLLFPLQIMRMPEILKVTEEWVGFLLPKSTEIERQRDARIISLISGCFAPQKNIILTKWIELCCKKSLVIYLSDKTEPFILNGSSPVIGEYDGQSIDTVEMYYPVSSDICLALVNRKTDELYEDIDISRIQKINEISIGKRSRFFYSHSSIKSRFSEYNLQQQRLLFDYHSAISNEKCSCS